MQATRIMVVLKTLAGIFLLALGLAIGSVLTVGAETSTNSTHQDQCDASITSELSSGSSVEWSSSPRLPGQPY